MAKTAAPKNRAKKAVAKKSKSQKKVLPKKIIRKTSAVKNTIRKKPTAVTTNKKEPAINAQAIENDLQKGLTNLQKAITNWFETKTKELNKIKVSINKASSHLSKATERKNTITNKLKQKRTATSLKQMQGAKDNYTIRKNDLNKINQELSTIKAEVNEANRMKRKFTKLMQTINKFNTDWIKAEKNKTLSRKKIKTKKISSKKPSLAIESHEFSDTIMTTSSPPTSINSLFPISVDNSDNKQKEAKKPILEDEILTPA